MAKFGRMKLMATAIRRFLVQVKRHDKGSYNALRKAVRERYEASDSAYGSDENFMACARNSPRSWFGPSHNEGSVNPIIELISPTSGQKKGTTKATVTSPEQGSRVSNGSAEEKLSSPPLLTILDFAYDSQSNRFTHCPAGLELHRAHYRDYEDQHLLLMLNSTCGECPLKSRCPISHDPMLCQLRMNGKDLRLAQRRAAERTDAFKTDYRMRGGIEATNSMLKRATGLDRLRVRGRPAVFSSILLKVAGWNLLRAASVRSLIAKLTKGGESGGSALSFAASYRRHPASSIVLAA